LGAIRKSGETVFAVTTEERQRERHRERETESSRQSPTLVCGEKINSTEVRRASQAQWSFTSEGRASCAKLPPVNSWPTWCNCSFAIQQQNKRNRRQHKKKVELREVELMLLASRYIRWSPPFPCTFKTPHCRQAPCLPVQA